MREADAFLPCGRVRWPLSKVPFWSCQAIRQGCRVRYSSMNHHKSTLLLCVLPATVRKREILSPSLPQLQQQGGPQLVLASVCFSLWQRQGDSALRQSRACSVSWPFKIPAWCLFRTDYLQSSPQHVDLHPE